MKVEVPDFLALGQRMPPPPKRNGTRTSNTSVLGLNNVGSVRARVCMHLQRGKKKEREECVNCSVSTCQADTGKFLRSRDQQGI